MFSEMRWNDAWSLNMYCLSEVGNFWVGLPDLKEENWLQLYHGWQRAEYFSGV